MKTIAALLLLTTCVSADDTAMSALRSQLAKAQGGSVVVAGINPRTLADAVVELDARPNYRVCLELNIAINADIGVEAAKAVREAILDGVTKIKQACADAGVP